MAALTVLTVNIGSSSLKASLFDADGSRQDFNYVMDHASNQDAVEVVFKSLLSSLGNQWLDVIGHRLVHGGDIKDVARLITQKERGRLNEMIALAPLHLPNSLKMVDLCVSTFGDVPQVACFDNAFHATLPEIAYRLPLPKRLNIRRYGFHGLSYAHIAKQLPVFMGDLSKRRVIVAHLGSGASLCMLENLKSVDTTMGYTPAGGIPMATRSGDIDPGVMLALAKTHRYDALCKITFEQMGLYALSDEISADVKTLLRSEDERAKFALDYYAREVRGAIGALAAKFGGLDALVFTGGIGEHAPEVRASICDGLQCLGIALSPVANEEKAIFIHSSSSKPVLVIRCDEESEMASLVKDVVS